MTCATSRAIEAIEYDLADVLAMAERTVASSKKRDLFIQMDLDMLLDVLGWTFAAYHALRTEIDTEQVSPEDMEYIEAIERIWDRLPEKFKGARQ